MWITNRTSVTFDMPEEYNKAEEFKKLNDMTEWVEEITSRTVTFRRVDTVQIMEGEK